MGSTLLGDVMDQVSQVTMVSNWKLIEDGESEDGSFSTSSSNLKRSTSLNVIDDYIYIHEEEEAHASPYYDATSYRRMPFLQPRPLSVGNPPLHTALTKDNSFIKNEEAHSPITTDNYFFNPHDTKILKYPLHYDDSKADPTIAPPFIPHFKQPYDQIHHIDHAQAPDYALLQYDQSLPPSPRTAFVSEHTFQKHLLAKYDATQAGESHINCLAQHFNEALLTTSDGAYISYLPCPTFSTSPTPPSIISTSSSPITSLASRTSTITDTASIAPDNCQDNHFVSSTEMMPSLMMLHTRSLMNRTSKRKNVEIDKIIIKKKRKRTRSRKNSEELESQRMTHIAVERNRRRQMNQHLNDLRSLMPSSYIQRGDQASIVGGAIKLIEELEKMLESLHLQKAIREGTPAKEQEPISNMVADKILSTRMESYACSQSTMVNVQVEMVSLSSIFVKVIAPKRHHQLLHTLQALNFLSLKVLHLYITTLDITILYSFSLKMENDCQFQTPLELAKSIQHVFETPKTQSQ